MAGAAVAAVELSVSLLLAPLAEAALYGQQVNHWTCWGEAAPATRGLDRSNRSCIWPILIGEFASVLCSSEPVGV